MIDETTVNTEENTPKRTNGKPFVHNDPRINRKGRPRSFNQLRKLAVLVAAEENSGGITRVLEILRDMAKSKEIAKQSKFLEYSYGKVSDLLDVTSKGEKINEIVIRYADDNNTTEAPPIPAPGETRTPPV